MSQTYGRQSERALGGPKRDKRIVEVDQVLEKANRKAQRQNGRGKADMGK